MLQCKKVIPMLVEKNDILFMKRRKITGDEVANFLYDHAIVVSLEDRGGHDTCYRALTISINSIPLKRPTVFEFSPLLFEAKRDFEDVTFNAVLKAFSGKLSVFEVKGGKGYLNGEPFETPQRTTVFNYDIERIKAISKGEETVEKLMLWAQYLLSANPEKVEEEVKNPEFWASLALEVEPIAKTNFPALVIAIEKNAMSDPSEPDLDSETDESDSESKPKSDLGSDTDSSSDSETEPKTPEPKTPEHESESDSETKTPEPKTPEPEPPKIPRFPDTFTGYDPRPFEMNERRTRLSDVLTNDSSTSKEILAETVNYFEDTMKLVSVFNDLDYMIKHIPQSPVDAKEITNILEKTIEHLHDFFQDELIIALVEQLTMFKSSVRVAANMTELENAIAYGYKMTSVLMYNALADISYFISKAKNGLGITFTGNVIYPRSESRDPNDYKLEFPPATKLGSWYIPHEYDETMVPVLREGVCPHHEKEMLPPYKKEVLSPPTDRKGHKVVKVSEPLDVATEWVKFSKRFNPNVLGYKALNQLSMEVQKMSLSKEVKDYIQMKLLELMTSVLTKSHVPKTVIIPKVPIVEWDERVSKYTDALESLKKDPRPYIVASIYSGSRRVGKVRLLEIPVLKTLGKNYWIYAPKKNYDPASFNIDFKRYNSGTETVGSKITSPSGTIIVAMPDEPRDYVTIFTNIIHMISPDFDEYGLLVIITRRFSSRGNYNNQVIMEFIECQNENAAVALSNEVNSGGYVSVI
jgi:hypothetical protein